VEDAGVKDADICVAGATPADSRVDRVETGWLIARQT